MSNHGVGNVVCILQRRCQFLPEKFDGPQCPGKRTSLLFCGANSRLSVDGYGSYLRMLQTSQIPIYHGQPGSIVKNFEEHTLSRFVS